MNTKLRLLTYVSVVAALVIIRSSEIPTSLISVIAGAAPILLAIWIVYRMAANRIQPDGSKSAGVGMVFWCLGTGSWFFLVEFVDLSKNQAILFIVAVQLIALIWLAPIIISRKMKLKKAGAKDV